ncbi:hypothetical protein GE21DRAFT_4597 [Neurospora crassa]|uniref:Uncharacterized protein n=1 Tax=Neurospora crassa (strain ATCC 24698 / 74-OR23-1A / CBS 708.71 / DSM 1257 / FGSC 987) TaxID=367110 RepID=Q7RZS6_NEUCR|nr:hypothetical protein NCU00288 [Neurospora crassa OR74A]EAA28523.2 hypothetical protein NCU00288 [Neurospora crassa OR74A]KHE89614.1 hypothetical protein GE21DRAFT_4597 [Neurospora crassa]|eukprot:XP_957759.2 hypothetical protein NCU00288 [Neurospora crassa OR74A]
MEGTYAQPLRVIRHRTFTLLRRLDDIAMPPHENFNHMNVRKSQKVVAVGIFPPQPPKTSERTTRRFGPSRHRLVRVRSRSDGRPTAAPHTGTQRHGGPKAGRRILRPFCNVGSPMGPLELQPHVTMQVMATTRRLILEIVYSFQILVAWPSSVAHLCETLGIADDEALNVLVQRARRARCGTVHPIRNTLSRTPKSSPAKTEPVERLVAAIV